MQENDEHTQKPKNILTLGIPLWLAVPLLTFVLALGVGGGVFAAQLLTPARDCPEEPEVCAEFDLFWQAWDIASDNFVDPTAVDPEAMTAGAIEGMLDALGDEGHTRFLSAESATAWREALSGEFEGIGAYIDVQDDEPIIVSPIPGAPAEEAGLEAGDVIIAVDGESTQGMGSEELISKVRGPRDTEVTLTIRREGVAELLDITITRSRVEIPSVTWEMLPGDVGLVKLNSFSLRAAEEMEAALEEVQAAGAQALIFDLRNNPGGVLDEAVAIASQFLPEGTTVLIEEDRAGNRAETRVSNPGVAQEIPMVVLVNENSASSAEIVAGALQEAGRAEVIGVPTVGTGTVLRPFNLEGGAQLLLGTKQWLTPEGNLIRNQGITPDILVALDPGVTPLFPRDAVELDAEQLRSGEDTQLARGYELLVDLAQQ